MTEDIDAAQAFDLIAALPSAEGYSPDDKYRDFRQVLLGSDAGKRVLREILTWTHTLRSSVIGRPIDPYLTHVHEGERNIGIKLQNTLLFEPKAKPQMQERRA